MEIRTFELPKFDSFRIDRWFPNYLHLFLNYVPQLIVDSIENN